MQQQFLMTLSVVEALTILLFIAAPRCSTAGGKSNSRNIRNLQSIEAGEVYGSWSFGAGGILGPAETGTILTHSKKRIGTFCTRSIARGAISL